MGEFLRNMLSYLKLIKMQAKGFAEKRPPLGEDQIRLEEREKRTNRDLIAEIEFLLPMYKTKLGIFSSQSDVELGDLNLLLQEVEVKVGKLKRANSYLKISAAEVLEKNAARRLGETMEDIEARVAACREAYNADALLFVKTEGQKLLEDAYVQSVLAGTHDWKNDDVSPFQKRVIKLVGDINSVLKSGGKEKEDVSIV